MTIVDVLRVINPFHGNLIYIKPCIYVYIYSVGCSTTCYTEKYQYNIQRKKGPRSGGLGYVSWGSGAVGMSVPETCGNVSVLRVLNHIRVFDIFKSCYLMADFTGCFSVNACKEIYG